MDHFVGELLLSWSEEYEGAGIGELDVVASEWQMFRGSRKRLRSAASDLNDFAHCGRPRTRSTPRARLDSKAGSAPG